MKKYFKIMLTIMLLLPIITYAETCTKEGNKYRTSGGLLVEVDSGEFNYYCYGIEHCSAKDGEYYDKGS